MVRRKTIQYFSDLHLERCHRLPLIVQTADHLILAGDIGHPQTEIYHEFMERCAKQYENVFMVYGNHEWDRGSPRSFLPANVHLLENSRFTLVENRLSLLGATLWTPTVRKADNASSVRFFETQLQALEDPAHQVICISHHLPSYGLIAPQYQKRKGVHSRFANHLDFLLKASYAPRYWICGHSHSIVSKTIGRTHCLINTYGHTYRPTLVFDV